MEADELSSKTFCAPEIMRECRPFQSKIQFFNYSDHEQLF